MVHDSTVIPVKTAPLSTLGRELQEALLQVTKIEQACLGTEVEQEAQLDDFTLLKKEVYGTILETKKAIRDRADLLAAEGNSVDAIQKASLINRNNDMMVNKFQQLKEAFKKASKRAVDPAELDVRFEELQVIKKQIEECRDLSKNASAYSEQKVMQLTDFVKQMEQAGVQAPAEFDGGEGAWREPTAEEMAVISRWAARDKEFDKRIFEVGKGVDKLKDIAEGMGAKLEAQARLAIDLSRQADEANQEVIKINDSMQSLVHSGSGLNLCCKLLLTIILICLICNITPRALLYKM
ncbi:putative transmembrane protein [Gregarina niphandrodes]|uniref:Transmembrane protein n=1 Tax=Gregarina niphandrodes TaxID=110365 RepID=A0A023B9Y5_GRENI|nr:putative transmembrane protein [Gregarina niphandrodes]EZG77011.1 putative transmembrane protein [Gregarina niphandrodes]|eukprot:XP_011129538.1 putative transmembrane protein [Gregarina niphandrodes]